MRQTFTKDAVHFKRGMPLRIRWSGGSPVFVRASRTWRAWQWLRWRVLGPFRRKTVVIAIDVARGTVTCDLEPKRWWHFL